MKKIEGHLAVTNRKVIQYRVINIREKLSENLVENIDASSRVEGVLRPPSHVGFKGKVQELRRGSLGGTTYFIRTEATCNTFRFSLDGCHVPESFDVLRSSKLFDDGGWYIHPRCTGGLWIWTMGSDYSWMSFSSLQGDEC